MASQQEPDDDDEVFDDEVLETLQLIKERATNTNDIIVRCVVKIGEPAIDEKKKKHPTYDVQLIGKRGTTRTRSYRFGSLRTFDSQCRTELGSHLKEPFPANSIMSKMGGMGESEIAARAKALQKWMNDVLKCREQMSPMLQQATAHVLQLGERQLFVDQDIDSDDELDERGVSKERSTTPIFKSGYLLKKGKVNTAFKKRFFVLDPNVSTFLYFDSEKTYEKYCGDDGSSLGDSSDNNSTRSSMGASLQRSLSFSRRFSMSLSGSSHGRESCSVAGGEGPLGSIQLPGATLEHVPGNQDLIVKTVESTYPLRAPSGAEAGDWATAIRAAVLSSGRSGPRSQPVGSSLASLQAADAEFEEVSTLLKTVGLESYCFRLSCVPGLKPGVNGLEKLTNDQLIQNVGMSENEILLLRKAIEKLELNSTSQVKNTTNNDDEEDEDEDMAAAFMKELETQEAGGVPSPMVEVAEKPFITMARKVLEANPRNLTARALIKDDKVSAWLEELDPVSFVRLNTCVKSGLERPQSMIGSYAHSAADYDDFKPLFNRIITDCHRKKPESNIHLVGDDTWQIQLPSSSSSTDSINNLLDFRQIGVTRPLFMVVSVSRNFTEFPFPAGMTISQRLKMEKLLSVGLNKLCTNLGVDGERRGGQLCSLTPIEAWTQGEDKVPPSNLTPCSYTVYQSILKKGMAQYLFKKSSKKNSATSPSSSPTGRTSKAHSVLHSSNDSKVGGAYSDPFNQHAVINSAGLNADWPIGRGVFVSQDGSVVVKYGFEDHVHVTVAHSGFVLSDIFSQLHQILKDLCSDSGLTFSTHPTLGHLTSCPSNLGSGMVAEVRGLSLPHYRNKFTDAKVTKDAIEFGLDVVASAFKCFPPLTSTSSDSSSVGVTGGSHLNINVKDYDEIDNDENEDHISETEVDISVIRKLYIKESDIAKRIYMYVQKLILLNKKYDPVIIAEKLEKEKQEQLAQLTASKIAEAENERLKLLLEFKEMLENGVNVVKFNRRGKVAFRTLLLVGDHTLTWRADNQKKQKSSSSSSSSSSPSSNAKTGDLFDLRQMSHIQLGEEPEIMITEELGVKDKGGKGKTNVLKGTSTLRIHVNKHKDIRSMMENGQCCSLVFKERSIDIGLDCEDQRDAIVDGFKLLIEDLTKRSNS